MLFARIGDCRRQAMSSMPNVAARKSAVHLLHSRLKCSPHHRSEPPGATIDKSAVAAPNKAATVATSARRGYIFLSE